ncbi:MAG: hypothetical protein K9K66_19045 [Desulfarculaceae bacterium]|nr:hypothetical protein [Desulfarculaceae bacterium]MCF8073600.1 hypothetical protein [Desulfarculaceae bacterium]MCF8103757.1 hypothetical protein [Desulfarculaceae bacterium]MCF8115684.1 hypothetical protein [Desulfarculaceae bacterium]
MCAALAAGGLYYWCAARHTRAARVAGVLASLDQSRRGLLLLGPRRDPSLPARLLHTPLSVAPSGDLSAWLPAKTHYRRALLGGFSLARAQTLWLTVASDDGLRVRIDGCLVYDAWHQHRELRQRLPLELAAGPHLVEADYFQAAGTAALSLRLAQGDGAAVALHPPAPGWSPARWQALLHHAKEQGFRALALGGLALLCLVAGLAWVLAGPLPASLRRLAGRPRPRDPPAPYTARDWLVPTLGFAAFALLVLAALAWKGADLPVTILKGKWDVAWYHRLITQGYYLDLNFPLYAKGSISWFPLFSWLARPWCLLRLTDPQWASLITAWLAALAAFHMLHRVAHGLFGRRAAVWALVFLAAYPCSFYLLLGFPYGLCLALGLAYFWCLWQERFWLAALWGLLAGLSYPLAVAGAVLPLLVLGPRALRARDPWPLARALVLTSAAPIAGMCLLFIHHWLAYGDFFVYLNSQLDWGRRPGWPWKTIYQHLAQYPWREHRSLSLILWLGGLALFAHRFVPALWALLAALFWLNHSSGSLLSNFRQYLAAWPWFLLLASSPRPAWLKAAWAAVMLWFFWRQFLPSWLTNNLM